jgi:hypothetical protein
MMTLYFLGIHLVLVMVLLKKPLVIFGFILELIGIMLDKFVVIREHKVHKVYRV